MSQWNPPHHSKTHFRSDSPGAYQPFAHPEAYNAWRESGRPPLPFNPVDGGRNDHLYGRPEAQAGLGMPSGNGVSNAWRNRPQAGYEAPVDHSDQARVNRDDHPPQPGPSNYRQPVPLSYSRGNFIDPPYTTRSYSSASSRPRGPNDQLKPEASAYLPPQRRAPSAPLPDHPPNQGAQPPPTLRPFFPNFATQQSPPALLTRDNPPAPTITLPPPEYIELSRQPLSKAETGSFIPKLLVLDLNGALVYRRHGGGGRKPYPRPYLGSFLEYLFLPEPGDSGKKDRPWEVFVWSSAQPHNVKSMVESTFGDRWIEGIWGLEDPEVKSARVERGEGRLKGVWARDKMGLNQQEYSQKTQTVKDLRQIHDHLKSQRPSDDATTEDPSEPVFDESNTVLLDDSPLKAILQPWSQIVIPEYDKVEFNLSKVAAAALLQDQAASHEGLDEILLGVIGILEALHEVDNVPAWIRAGGLIPSLNEVVLAKLPDLAQVVLGANPPLESLPSHDTFIHWYTEPTILGIWKAKGVEALKRKGITPDIGKIEGAGELSSAPNSPMPGSPAASRSEYSGVGSPPPQRRSRRYTPSAPAGDEGPNVVSEVVETSSATVPPRDTSGNKYIPRALRSKAVALDPNGLPKSSSSASAQFRLRPVDSWRTFRAFDVALYLQDVADRPSPLSPLQRQSLLDTIEALVELSPASEWQSTRNDLHDGWTKDMCEKCTLEAGIKEANRLKQEAVQRGKEAGLEGTIVGNANRGKKNTSKGKDKELAPGTGGNNLPLGTKGTNTPTEQILAKSGRPNHLPEPQRGTVVQSDHEEYQPVADIIIRGAAISTTTLPKDHVESVQQLPHDRRSGISNPTRSSARLSEMAARNQLPTAIISSPLLVNGVGADVASARLKLQASTADRSVQLDASRDANEGMPTVESSLSAKARRHHDLAQLKREYAGYVASGREVCDFDQYRKSRVLLKSLRHASLQHVFRIAWIEAIGPMPDDREEPARRKLQHIADMAFADVKRLSKKLEGMGRSPQREADGSAWQAEEVMLSKKEMAFMSRSGITVEAVLERMGNGHFTTAIRQDREAATSISKSVPRTNPVEQLANGNHTTESRLPEGSDVGKRIGSRRKRRRVNSIAKIKPDPSSSSGNGPTDEIGQTADSPKRLGPSVRKRRKTTPETDNASRAISPSSEEFITPQLLPPISSLWFPSIGKLSLAGLVQVLNDSEPLPTEHYL